MNRCWRHLAIASFSIATLNPLAVAVRADAPAEARNTFNALYASKLREVGATSDKSDDAALAQQMAQAAKLAQDTPALMTLLCEQAFQLGLRDKAGYPAALAAMQLLGEKRPDVRIETMQKIVQIRQQEFNASRSTDRAAAGGELISAMVALSEARVERSDHVASLEDLRKALVVARQINSSDAESLKDRVRLANQQAQLARQIDGLRTRLLRDRTDAAAAEELVALYVRELNEPAKAAEYAPLVRDTSWQRHLDLSKREIDKLSEDEAIALARWYRQQAEEASATGKPALQQRAARYYRQFLAAHTAQDLERTQATLELKQLEDTVGAASAAPTADSSAPPLSSKGDGLATVAATYRKTLHQDPKMVSAVSIDPSGKLLATTSQPEGTLRVFNLEKQSEIAVLSDEKKWLTSVSFASKGDLLVTGDLHNDVQIWNTKAGKRVANLRRHTSHIYAVAFSPDAGEIASAGSDRVIHIWDAANASWKKQFSGHGDTVRSLAFSPGTTRTLASGGDDAEVRLWRTGSDDPVVLKGHKGQVHVVAFSHDGKLLASGDQNGLVIIWDTAKNQVVHQLDLGATARTVAFSPDGTALFAGGDGKLIRFWNTTSGKALGDLSGHTQIVSGLAFSPDGKTLVSSSNDGSVRLWDVTRQRAGAALSQSSQK